MTHVLALVQREMRVTFERLLASLNLDVIFIDKASDLSALAHAGKQFSVAILPASLPDADIWALWGEVKLLQPRPEILVYARTANYQVWSGVLEAGGHDILVEPFSAEELQRAVLHAKRTFDERVAQETDEEP